MTVFIKLSESPSYYAELIIKKSGTHTIHWLTENEYEEIKESITAIERD